MLNPTIQTLLEILRENGINAFAAGGAARDGMLGVEPRDYDIVIAGGDAPLSQFVYELVQQLGAEDIDDYGAAYRSGANSVMDSRIQWVVSATLDAQRFDIILYCAAMRPVSIEEHVELFDCNLNFFYYSECGRRVESTPKSWKPGEVVQFTKLCDYPFQRRVYLMQKYPSILFPSTSELIEQLKGI